jgi:hypothetical protein
MAPSLGGKEADADPATTSTLPATDDIRLCLCSLPAVAADDYARYRRSPHQVTPVFSTVLSDMPLSGMALPMPLRRLLLSPVWLMRSSKQKV